MGSDVWLRSAEANIQLEGRVRVDKVGADLQADRHAERATGHLHAQDRPGDAGLHGDARPGDLHRRPQRDARHRGAPHRAHGPWRRDPDHRPNHRHAVPAQAHAHQHRETADLGDRPRLLPDHRLSGERSQPGGAGRGAADRPGLLLQRALERAGARPDPGSRRADRPDRDPPGRVDQPGGRRHAHPARGGLADRQEDLPHLQRRLLSRLQPAQLQESRRESRVPVQPRVEAAEPRSSRPSSRATTSGRPTGSGTPIPYQIGFDILWEREF